MAFLLAFAVAPVAAQTSPPAITLQPRNSTDVSQAVPRGDLLRPGEAYVTRFSGTTDEQISNNQPITVINTNGVVGSIIDIRSPRRPPLGEHWYDKPERNPVTAGEVGQVFGVVLDDARPPNVYLSATAAFGLHLTPDTQDWMPGMWGAGGGPGTIYRLSADNGYRPSVFANVTLDGRANSGPALGNMAFDRTHRQLLVSDLETGMIHRFRVRDGTNLGFYDHGVTGRDNFFDVPNNIAASLPAITFDPLSRAHVSDCSARPFERSPQCWNFAASGRRVWGVGVRHDVATDETRLYYAVWSSPAFGNGAAWKAASDDDKRNAVWSIRLGPDGDFDTGDIRREFLLPDFFVQSDDIERAGFSQPVSDISFSECTDRPVMLIAERGGIRNLGLSADNPFAFPHDARALRYELDTSGVWQLVGRYDVGYYDRKNEGQPFLRANCAGGIAFAPGYAPDGTMDLAKADQYVWMTGDYLCSPDAPCHLFGATPPVAAAEGTVQQVSSQTAINADGSQVHGAEGLAEGNFDALMPAGALAPYPISDSVPYPASGPDRSYLIDTDVYIDAAGRVIEAERLRNDATKVGDIAIYESCQPHRQVALLPPQPSSATPVSAPPDSSEHVPPFTPYGSYPPQTPTWDQGGGHPPTGDHGGGHPPTWNHGGGHPPTSNQGSGQMPGWNQGSGHMPTSNPNSGQTLTSGQNSGGIKLKPAFPQKLPATAGTNPAPSFPATIPTTAATPPKPSFPTTIATTQPAGPASPSPPLHAAPLGSSSQYSVGCNTSGATTTCTDSLGNKCTSTNGSCQPQKTSADRSSSPSAVKPASTGQQSAGTGQTGNSGKPAIASGSSPAGATSHEASNGNSSGKITLQQNKFGGTSPAGAGQPVNSGVASASNAGSSANTGIVLRPRTYGQQPSAGQAQTAKGNTAIANTASNGNSAPSHPSQSKANPAPPQSTATAPGNAGNKQHSASLTQTGRHQTAS